MPPAPAHRGPRHARAGYRAETAASINAAASTIGPIIPPSLPMVIYGVTADASIGRLFLAGVIPGPLMGVSLMVHGRRGGATAGISRAGVRRSVRDLARVPRWLLGDHGAGDPARRHVQGYFTPTEAAAVASSVRAVPGLRGLSHAAAARVPQLLIDSAEVSGLVWRW